MPTIVRTLDEAIAPIADGGMLAVPRESSGAAMAATRALIRRGVRRLHLVTLPTSSLQADLLIGAGCVETLETSAVSLGEFGPAPRFTAAILGGTIRMRDATCPALHAQFQAAEKGTPFMPLREPEGRHISCDIPPLTYVTAPVTFDQSSRSCKGHPSGGMPGGRGECGARGRTCTPLPGGFWVSVSRHYDRGGRCFPGLGQAKAGNARKRFLLAHDRVGKPVSTFPDHARVPKQPESLAVNRSNDDFAVYSAMLKAGFKRKPKATPIEFARRVAVEKLSLQRRYCDAFGQWRSCGRPLCRRQQSCRGDANACLKRVLDRVPQTCKGARAKTSSRRCRAIPRSRARSAAMYATRTL